MNNKIRVLTINCVYDKYSTGKIAKDIEKFLSDKCEFIFCYEIGPKTSENKYRIASKLEYRFYYLLARLTGLKYCTGYTTTFRLLKFIKKQSPDIVHIHCPNTGAVNIPWLMNYLKKNNIPTIITNHAEFYYTGNCPHAFECMKFTEGCGNCNYIFDPHRKFLFDRTAYEWKKMKKAFEGFSNAVAVSVSPWVMSRQMLSPIMNEIKSVVIKNGIDTDNVFYLRNNNLKEKLNLPTDKKIILYASGSFSDRTDDIKGGHYILKLAKIMPEVLFVVVGSCHLSEGAQIPPNVLIMGEIRDQNLLAEYYSAADATVMASRRETYGMVVAESLCCGTPVVGFKAGGPESIALEAYSSFVEYGDLIGLSNALNEWLNKKISKSEISSKSIPTYSFKNMAEEYYNIYKGKLK